MEEEERDGRGTRVERRDEHSCSISIRHPISMRHALYHMWVTRSGVARRGTLRVKYSELFWLAHFCPFWQSRSGGQRAGCRRGARGVSMRKQRAVCALAGLVAIGVTAREIGANLASLLQMLVQNAVQSGVSIAEAGDPSGPLPLRCTTVGAAGPADAATCHGAASGGRICESANLRICGGVGAWGCGGVSFRTVMKFR